MAARSTIRAHYDIKNAVEHLFDVEIFGKTISTTVTKHPEAVTEWINGVYSEGIVHHTIGFEVEQIVVGDRLIIGTVQFCVGHRCLVIQLVSMFDFPYSLDQFLSDPKHTFVAIQAESKIRMLSNQCPFIEGPVAYRDLGEAAAQFFFWPEFSHAGQNELLEAALGGVGIEKPAVQLDWGRPDRLSERQVQYACVDALASYELGRRFILNRRG